MDNIQKNTYVKNQITNALLDLLKNKELKNISISEITSIAQVGRASFYRNYNNKEDILKEHLNKLIVNWQEEYDKNKNENESVDDMFGSLFAHLKEHSDFYLLLSKRNLFYLLKDVLKDICGPKPEHPNLGAYAAAFICYGIYGWIEEWFARGMQESAEEMVILLKNRNLST